ncbi:hypothetical protein FZC66_07880 [Priestia megaterium]|nr:hypothetical protein FZC66_07880 [Priestia megaterium]
MFLDFLVEELAKRVGQGADFILDNQIVDGLIASVSADHVVVIEQSAGYGGAAPVAIPFDAINTVVFSYDD